MRDLVTKLSLLVLLSLLGGCWAMPPATPEQQSEYSLEAIFPDPKAQQLALAAEQGNTQEVRRLMKDEGVDPDKIFGAEGMPLLAWPIFTRNPEGLKAMLENGADPNVHVLHPAQNTTRFQGRHKDNAMVWAAKQEDPIYLKLLLDHGGGSQYAQFQRRVPIVPSLHLAQPTPEREATGAQWRRRKCQVRPSIDHSG
jgi:hypothetical protein